jgi:hypothetical protein
MSDEPRDFEAARLGLLATDEEVEVERLTIGERDAAEREEVARKHASQVVAEHLRRGASYNTTMDVLSGLKLGTAHTLRVRELVRELEHGLAERLTTHGWNGEVDGK